jgi:hypothetical protein
VSTPLTAVTFVRVNANILTQAKLVAVVCGPFILLIAAYFVAWLLAPNMTAPSNHGDLETFFTTTAVVLATILVALMVQDALFKESDLRPAVAVGIVYIILGELAATLSALPVNASGGLERHALALTVSATVGSLAAVLFIASRRWAELGPHLEKTPDGKNVVVPAGVQAKEAAAATPEAAPIAPSPIGGTRARRPSRIELAPVAVTDLQQLGTVNERLVAAALERSIAGDANTTPFTGTDGETYFDMKMGNLHAIYRPLKAEYGTPADGVLILRILTDGDLKDWGPISEIPIEQLLNRQPSGRVWRMWPFR